MSRRYRGLPDWQGLLSHFAAKIHPGNPLALQVFTQGKSHLDLPKVASDIETEFNKLWLRDPKFATERERHQEAVRGGASPFKIEVAAHINRAKNITGDKTVEDELALLKNVAKRSVAGIITTNYDCLLESIFENYRTFIGQQPLLFGKTQGVAEIYKIHGCCSQPDTLILTADDYTEFQRRNAYLAAKLLTIFVEHPIIFLGYSIGDENIQAILDAIIDCLGPENLDQIRQRLIFVEYSSEKLSTPVIGPHSIQIKGSRKSLTMTRVQMHEFLPLYRELQAKKYCYNPKLLRQIKRDIYQLSTTNEKVDRFQIADIEDDSQLEQAQTLVGIGVIPDNVQIAHKAGHSIPDTAKLYRDAVLHDADFQVKSLVEEALGYLQKHSGKMPICRYLKIYKEQFGPPPVALADSCPKKLTDLLSNTLLKEKAKKPNLSITAIVSNNTLPDSKKLATLPIANDLVDSLAELEKFLKQYLIENPDALSPKANGGLKTDLRRMIRIYDFLKYGQEKDAHNTEEESTG